MACRPTTHLTPQRNRRRTDKRRPLFQKSFVRLVKHAEFVLWSAKVFVLLKVVIVASHVCDVRNLCFKRYIILVFYECKE